MFISFGLVEICKVGLGNIPRKLISREPGYRDHGAILRLGRRGDC